MTTTTSVSKPPEILHERVRSASSYDVTCSCGWTFSPPMGHGKGRQLLDEAMTFHLNNPENDEAFIALGVFPYNRMINFCISCKECDWSEIVDSAGDVAYISMKHRLLHEAAAHYASNKKHERKRKVREIESEMEEVKKKIDFLRDSEAHLRDLERKMMDFCDELKALKKD